MTSKAYLKPQWVRCDILFINNKNGFRGNFFPNRGFFPNWEYNVIGGAIWLANTLYRFIINYLKLTML